MRYDPVPVEILLPDHWLGRVRYRLLFDLRISSYKVPQGFVTDGASVPRPLWNLFPPVGRYLVAAIVHDYWLEEGAGWPVSNRVFDQVLRDLEINWWRRVVMVNAVRANGLVQRFKSRIGLNGRHVSS